MLPLAKEAKKNDILREQTILFSIILLLRTGEFLNTKKETVLCKKIKKIKIKKLKLNYIVKTLISS